MVERSAVNRRVGGSSPSCGAISTPEYVVYILRSETTGSLYCGCTADLTRRLAQHNDPTYRLTLTTKRRPGPWILVWCQPLATRAAAMARERSIKRRGIARFLREHPE